MIRNIVFDMGNVLRDFNPMLCIRAYVKDEKDAEWIAGEMFGEKEWVALDQGTITYEGALEQWKKRLPERLHKVVEEISNHWHEYMPEDPRMLQLVKELKVKGYGLYLLSNASVRFSVYEKDFEALQHFDGKVVSAFHQVLKPDEKIYRILFDTYHLIPEECFFVDDNPANVEGGRKLGMSGHAFTGDLTALKEDFRRHGISL